MKQHDCQVQAGIMLRDGIGIEKNPELDAEILAEAAQRELHHKVPYKGAVLAVAKLYYDNGENFLKFSRELRDAGKYGEAEKVRDTALGMKAHGVKYLRILFPIDDPEADEFLDERARI